MRQPHHVKHWRTYTEILLWIAAFITFGGCNYKPVLLTQPFEATYIEPLPAELEGAFLLTDLSDGRHCDSSMGVVSGHQIQRDNILNWVASGLNALGVQTLSPAIGDAPAYNLSATLVMAHMKSCFTSMNANVVLHLQVKQGEAVRLDKHYRGRLTTPNMISGDGEIRAALDMALSRALKQFRIDAIALCKTSDTRNTSG